MRWIKRYIRILLLAASGGLAAITLLSFFATMHWVVDLLTHFRVHYLAVGSILLVLSLASRANNSAALAMMAIVLNLTSVAPDLAFGQGDIREAAEGTAQAASPDDEPRLKLLMANVLTSNRDFLRFQRLIHQEEPDIIGVLEVDQGWIDRLQYLRGRYPYGVARGRNDNFGVALYSRIPFLESDLLEFDAGGVELAMARMMFEGRAVTLVLAHAFPPSGRAYSTIRNQQLSQLAEIRKEHAADEFILMGDLNITPWSPHFRSLTRKTGLLSAARGFGWAPSWPTYFRPLMIPIDHALISSGLEAKAYRTGPVFGSDHLPLLMELVLREQLVILY